MSAFRWLTILLCLLGVVAALSRKAGEACLDRDAPAWFGCRGEVLEQVRRIDGATYSFAVLGDIQQGLETFQGALHKINGDPRIRFGVACGDLVNNETAPHYRLLFDAAETAGSRLPVLTVPGNHDDPENYRRLIGPTTWAVRLGPDILIGVDNAWDAPGAEQLEFLESRLSEEGIRHRFVFLHRPLLVNYGIRTGHEAALALFERMGVDAVFAGHSHSYDRVTRNGVLHLTNGLGGDISRGDGGLAYATVVHVSPGGFVTRRIPLDRRPEMISRIRDSFVAHFYAPLREAGLWSPLLAIVLGLALHAGFRAWGESAWLPVVALFAAGFASPPEGVLLGAGAGLLLVAAVLMNTSGRLAVWGRRATLFSILLLARSPWLTVAALLPALAARIRLPSWATSARLAFGNRSLLLAAVVIAIWAAPPGTALGPGLAILLLVVIPAWALLSKMRQSPA